MYKFVGKDGDMPHVIIDGTKYLIVDEKNNSGYFDGTKEWIYYFAKKQCNIPISCPLNPEDTEAERKAAAIKFLKQYVGRKYTVDYHLEHNYYNAEIVRVFLDDREKIAFIDIKTGNGFVLHATKLDRRGNLIFCPELIAGPFEYMNEAKAYGEKWLEENLVPEQLELVL